MRLMFDNIYGGALHVQFGNHRVPWVKVVSKKRMVGRSYATNGPSMIRIYCSLPDPRLILKFPGLIQALAELTTPVSMVGNVGNISNLYV
jgi:hypothetical protein